MAKKFRGANAAPKNNPAPGKSSKSARERGLEYFETHVQPKQLAEQKKNNPKNKVSPSSVRVTHVQPNQLNEQEKKNVVSSAEHKTQAQYETGQSSSASLDMVAEAFLYMQTLKELTNSIVMEEKARKAIKNDEQNESLFLAESANRNLLFTNQHIDFHKVLYEEESVCRQQIISLFIHSMIPICIEHETGLRNALYKKEQSLFEKFEYKKRYYVFLEYLRLNKAFPKTASAAYRERECAQDAEFNALSGKEFYNRFFKFISVHNDPYRAELDAAKRLEDGSYYVSSVVKEGSKSRSALDPAAFEEQKTPNFS